MNRRRRWLVAAAGALLAPWLVFRLAVRLGGFPLARLEPNDAASLTVLAAGGEVLRQSASGSGGRQSWVPLTRIGEHLVHATLAAEDHRFYQHHGVDPRGVLRAAWLNLRAGRIAFGGSTLTMQLVRLLGPDGRPARVRGLGAKWEEAVVAARLEREVTKPVILEQYLNRVYYGNGVWGAESAANFYLGKPASALSAGEAAFLAVLPRSPRRYNPLEREGLANALARRERILTRMQHLGWLTRDQANLAAHTPMVLRRDRPGFLAPHFVDHVLGEGRDAGGGTLTTTLDAPLQRALEVAVGEHLASVGGRAISQAGLVVLRNHDGGIVGMVGSGGYFDAAHDGAANVTTLRRRPGSTLKPFVYGLALERGDSPASLAYDAILPGEAHAPYVVDVRQHGLGRYREALAGSYNLAAVHTLARVGAAALADRLHAAGLTTLDRAGGYDVSLAIGDAEVKLLELTGAFAAFGNGGQPVRPHGLVAVHPPGGALLPAPRAPRPPAIFSRDIAYLVYDMLADPDARRPMFGSNTPTHLPFSFAIKTGTTRGYTDNLALGTTREFTVGAWAGNFDGTPTDGMMAMHGAAPLVRAALVALAARFGPPTAPERPPGLREAEVCPLSGKAPGRFCRHRKRELFAAGTLPDPAAACQMHARHCNRDVVIYPEVVRPWARAVKLTRPADEACAAPTTRGPLRIVFPLEGARFALDPHRSLQHQIPPLRALPAGAPVRWSIDGIAAERWTPSRGQHIARAELAGADASEVRFSFD